LRNTPERLLGKYGSHPLPQQSPQDLDVRLGRAAHADDVDRTAYLQGLVQLSESGKRAPLPGEILATVPVRIDDRHQIKSRVPPVG
jgi:hypothetical protein